MSTINWALKKTRTNLVLFVYGTRMQCDQLHVCSVLATKNVKCWILSSPRLIHDVSFEEKNALGVSTGFDMHVHRVNPAIVWLPHWAVHLTTFDGCQGAIPARWVILCLLFFYLISAPSSGDDNSRCFMLLNKFSVCWCAGTSSLCCSCNWWLHWPSSSFPREPELIFLKRNFWTTFGGAGISWR